MAPSTGVFIKSAFKNIHVSQCLPSLTSQRPLLALSLSSTNSSDPGRSKAFDVSAASRTPQAVAYRDSRCEVHQAPSHVAPCDRSAVAAGGVCVGRMVTCGFFRPTSSGIISFVGPRNQIPPRSKDTTSTSRSGCEIVADGC